jgi:hypothetical protein
MNRPLRAAALAVAAALAAAPGGRLVAGEPIALTGSYRLVKRVLPGGKKVTYPDIVGFTTYTKTERSLTLMWKDPSGAPVSLALIADFTLSKGKYCEKSVYWMQHNMGMPGISYTAPKEKNACAEVASDAESISFDVPGEPERMRFTREGFVAEAKDMWTDTWKRIE